jgi:hypothetical protein
MYKHFYNRAIFMLNLALFCAVSAQLNAAQPLTLWARMLSSVQQVFACKPPCQPPSYNFIAAKLSSDFTLTYNEHSLTLALGADKNELATYAMWGVHYAIDYALYQRVMMRYTNRIVATLCHPDHAAVLQHIKNSRQADMVNELQNFIAGHCFKGLGSLWLDDRQFVTDLAVYFCGNELAFGLRKKYFPLSQTVGGFSKALIGCGVNAMTGQPAAHTHITLATGTLLEFGLSLTSYLPASLWSGLGDTITTTLCDYVGLDDHILIGTSLGHAKRLAIFLWFLHKQETFLVGQITTALATPFFVQQLMDLAGQATVQSPQIVCANRNAYLKNIIARALDQSFFTWLQFKSNCIFNAELAVSGMLILPALCKLGLNIFSKTI